VEERRPQVWFEGGKPWPQYFEWSGVNGPLMVGVIRHLTKDVLMKVYQITLGWSGDIEYASKTELTL